MIEKDLNNVFHYFNLSNILIFLSSLYLKVKYVRINFLKLHNLKVSLVSIFALQSLVGGFLDEDLQHFNKKFDDWCIQFKSYEDAMDIVKTLENQNL